MAKLKHLVDILTDSAGVSDPRMDLFLMRSPLQLIAIVAVYLGIICKIGPAFMEKRKPFSLRKTIILYNLIQIVVNTVLCIKIAEHAPHLDLLCVADELPNDGIYVIEPYQLHHWYVLVKFFDLIETLFFVLRKKDRQISFLHVYHHCGILVAAWISGKYFPGGQGIFLGLFNTFVHAIMYGYYLYSSIRPNNTSVWWKKYITILQIVQQLAIYLTFVPVIFNPNCWYPKLCAFAFSTNVLAVGLMFVMFYMKTYN